VLVVSPHLDDAALSVGATLSMLRREGAVVTVATLFAGRPTGELSPIARRFHERCGQGCDAITERRQEDANSMLALGVDHLHLRWLDAVYRKTAAEWLCRYDGHVFALSPSTDHVLAQDIERTLRGLLARNGITHILAPMGIGNHVVHLIARAAAERVAEDGALRAFALFEDLPYALTVPDVRMHSPGYEPLCSYPAAADWAAKMRGVAAYPSQLRMLWGDHDWRNALSDYARWVGVDTPAERLWLKAVGPRH
jgi:LmbE family N-acetylglucosaminyl deacetylase